MFQETTDSFEIRRHSPENRSADGGRESEKESLIPPRAQAVTHGHDIEPRLPRVAATRIASITTDGVITESEEFRNSEPTGITSKPHRSTWFLGFGNDKIFRTNFPE